MKIATPKQLQKIAEQAGVSFGRAVEMELGRLAYLMKAKRLKKEQKNPTPTNEDYQAARLCVEDGWFMGLTPEQRERQRRAKAQAEAEEGVE